MKTRFAVYQIKNKGFEFVDVAGVFYGFNVGYHAVDWQEEFKGLYIPSNFPSVKAIKAYFGATNVRKVIKTGIAGSRELYTD